MVRMTVDEDSVHPQRHSPGTDEEGVVRPSAGAASLRGAESLNNDGPLARAARRLLQVAAVGVGLVLAYFLFDWQERLDDAVGVAFYLVAPVSVLVGLLLVLRSSGATQIKTVLLMISTVAPLYLVELVVEWRDQVVTFHGQSPEDVYAACPDAWSVDELCYAAFARGVPFDTRGRLEVIADLAAQGLTAWPNVYSPLIKEGSYLERDGVDVRPLAGISGVHTVFCNESGEWLTYDADEHGFNNPLGAHESPAQVVLVGDSFTQGRCMNREHTIQAQLREDFPRTTSLGLDGSGPLHELGALREYGERLEPEVVLWMFFEGNDLLDLNRERNDPILQRYLDPAFRQDLAAHQPWLDQALKARIIQLREEEEAKDEEFAVDALRRHRGRYTMTVSGLLTLRRLRRLLFEGLRGVGNREAPEYPSELMRSILTSAREDVESWGGELVFVYLPDWNRFGRPASAFPFRDEVLQDVEAVGLQVIDMVPVFTAHEEPTEWFPFGLSAHYNEEGYRRVGETIVRELQPLMSPSP